VPYFTVPDGKMDEFKKGYADFYKHTSEGTMHTGDCTYYGFTEEGNTVHCREGYKNADGVLKHLGEVLPSSITVARSCVPYSLHKLGLPISKGHLQRNVPSSPQIFVAPSICLAASLPLFRSPLSSFAQVKAELDTAVKLVGEGGLNLAVMGPAAELEKLKKDLGPLGCKFYALDSGKRFRYKLMAICYS
jgi:hypothetical protein